MRNFMNFLSKTAEPMWRQREEDAAIPSADPDEEISHIQARRLLRARERITMPNKPPNNNDRITALLRRETALKAAIAAEKVRRQKRCERERARLASVIGECLLADLDANPQLGLLIEDSLKRKASPRDAEFLRTKGFHI
jgi:hypothetical protein